MELQHALIGNRLLVLVDKEELQTIIECIQFYTHENEGVGPDLTKYTDLEHSIYQILS